MSVRVLLLHQQINDAAAITRYREAAHSLIAHFGGRVCAPPAAIETLEGRSPDLAIAIQFPNADCARTWFQSPEYGAARLLREDASTAQILLIDEDQQAAK